MLPGTSSLSKTAIIEQLVFVSGETSRTMSGLLRLFNEHIPIPEAPVLDKYLRQDIAVAKDRIDQTVERILEYISTARMDLVDHKEFYINIAQRYRAVVDSMEGIVYRLLLLRRKLPSEAEDEEILKGIRKMLDMLEQSLFLTSSSMRSLLSVSHGTAEVLRSIEKNNQKVRGLERSADELYRTLFEQVLDRHSSSLPAYILYREVIDKLEDAIDMVSDQSNDILILARSLSTA